MRTFPLILILLVVGFDPLAACTCGGTARPFIPQESGSLVLVGTVERYIERNSGGPPLAMIVRVERVLKGRYGAGTIRIVGDNGMQCLPYVSTFPIGTEWVLSVGGPRPAPGLGRDNYTFGMCSVDWLVSFGGHAYGSVTTADEEAISIDDLQLLLEDDTVRVKTFRVSDVLPEHQIELSFPRFSTGCEKAVERILVGVLIDDHGRVRSIETPGSFSRCSCCIRLYLERLIRRGELTIEERAHWGSLGRFELRLSDAEGAELFCSECALSEKPPAPP